ncbi:MAG TPA: ABC transporter permease [Candidatus Polarisedimenticolia bacterium]|nr:ABC transporter permease [Candidatus Polarisedimenticolia bacterium]
MSVYLLRRCLAAVPLLLGIVTLVFILLDLVPGEPFVVEPGAGARPAAGDHLREIFGADRPLIERYLAWLGSVARGDLGLSWSLRAPVSGAVGEAMRRTLLLVGAAIALQFALGIAAGIAAAVSRGPVDRLVSTLAGVLYAVPSYWLGLLLVALFAVHLGWLPVSQMHDPAAAALGAWASALDALRHLALPAFALALPAAGGVALFVRDEVSAELGSGVARAARSRGLRPIQVVLRHGLRRALLAVATLLGLALPGLASGSVVIEVLFAWPGMGRLAYQATLARDEPLVLGCACAAALLVIAGSLLADLLLAAIDPRVRERLA